MSVYAMFSGNVSRAYFSKLDCSLSDGLSDKLVMPTENQLPM